MLERFEFMPIEELLAKVGAGIGTANRALAHNSSTDAGTLVVKDANVTVNFEMTTLYKKDENSTELSLGAKTLSFGIQNASEKNEDSIRNTVNISMNIVSVMEKLPDNKDILNDEIKAGPIDKYGKVITENPHSTGGTKPPNIVDALFKPADSHKSSDKSTKASTDVKANLAAYEKIFHIIEARIKEFPYDEKSKKEMNGLLIQVKEFVKNLEFEKANNELLKIYKILIP